MKGRLSWADRQYFKRIQCKAENRMAFVCCAKEVNIEDLLPRAPNCGMQFTDRVINLAEILSNLLKKFNFRLLEVSRQILMNFHGLFKFSTIKEMVN